MRGLVVGNNLNATAAVGQDLGADGPPRCPVCGSSAPEGRDLAKGGQSSALSTVLRVGDLILDTITRDVQRAGKPCKPLSPRETLLLKLLMENPGKTFSRKEIVEHAWRIQFHRGTNIVDMNINRLRVKMDTGFETRMIETERGKGYRLKVEGPISSVTS